MLTYGMMETADELREAMAKIGRDYYTYEGYEWMIELFNEDPEPQEFDGIAIACEFNEEEADYFVSEYEDTIREYFDIETPEGEDIDPDAIDLEDFVNYYSIGAVLDNGNIIWAAF